MAAFIAVDNAPLSGLNVKFTFQCNSPSSQSYGLFYDVQAQAWAPSPVWNSMSPQSENPGMYVASVLTSALNGGRAEDYVVVYKSFTSSTPFIDAEIWQFGSGVDQLIADLHLYQFAQTRSLTRLNGDFAIQESVFDDAGRERFRFLSVQDPTGNQPEETRTNTSGNIL